jgi:hypothetical protein
MVITVEREIFMLVRERESSAVADTSLPDIMYVLNGEQKIVLIRRGMMGYSLMCDGWYETNHQTVLQLNAPLEITPAQAMAMKTGSMFGFHVPGAVAATWEDRFGNRQIVLDDFVM